MRILQFSIWILQLAICNSAGALSTPAQTILHVSPQGDDASDGSLAHPLKTLHGAQQRIRERFAIGTPRWVRVEIAPGRYVLDKPFVLTSSDSGESREHNVTYAAAGGEVTISGGQRLNGWRPAGVQWITDIPATMPAPRDLWVNGRRAIRARSPNTGYFRIDHAGSDNRSSFTVQPNDFSRFTHPQTAEVVFLHDWSISRVRLAGMDATSRTYRFADPIGPNQPQFAISNFEPHPRYFVENAPQLLDAPGEWYFDETTRKAFYMPRDGETVDSAEIVAPRLEQLVVLREERGKPVENVRFEGLTFSYSQFQMPPHGYAGIQACVHERRAHPNDSQDVALTAAVRLENARGCSLSHCRFEHLAACGLHIAHARDCHIESTVFRDIGGNGIMIGSIHRHESPVAENNVIDNCLIEKCGTTFFGAVGLWIGFAADTTVRNNELRALPYSGISVGWAWGDVETVCRHHVIRQNHIHGVMQILSDGGGIYTLGRQPGTVLCENVIHDIPPNAGRAQSNGIFMDEGSTDIRVERNTIYNVARSPIRFNLAGRNEIVANRLATAPGVPTFHYDGTGAKMMIASNEEIADANWRPKPSDPAVKRAGPAPGMLQP